MREDNIATIKEMIDIVMNTPKQTYIYISSEKLRELYKIDNTVSDDNLFDYIDSLDN